ncbi:MmcQ/YjbR family DNA-binding protein [Algoriphagus antarcticus]|uniref:Putative DNA-binding protein (MmcQ/YjbR family) n=1 Tax=Algoriphagus antarcticus TaxID=238540 RepID=A0A3E0DX42_9BACT|nr:MmcQ/YjbR family DNA-binding protein [Algoriphagus antarcticus]REG90632.1 putative DNA-binding protein (MmcQ/YjbR family) [Algoriphagus antarcticus]
MTLEYYRDYCLAKPGVTEDTPFDQDTLCFRVGKKIFSICSISDFQYINLKCDPERAVELREQYDGITPGFHMNKQQWNSVSTTGNVPDRVILELADHSYELIFGSLTKKLQAEIRP